MSERRRYTKREKAAAVVTAELSSTLAAAEAHGIPRKTIAYWLDDPAFATLRQKTREDMAAGFDVLVQMAAARLQELIPAMEPRDLTVLLGVAADKGQLLAGNATNRTEHVGLTDSWDDHEKGALRDAIRTELEKREALT